MTFEQTQALIAVLSSAYPRATIPEATVHAYHRHLEDLPYQLAQAAVTATIDTCTYFPTIAEFRAQAARLLVTDRAPEPARLGPR